MLTNATEADEMPHLGLLIIFARRVSAVLDIQKCEQCNDLARAENLSIDTSLECYCSIMAYAQV